MLIPDLTCGTVGVRAWRGASHAAGRAHLGGDVVGQTGGALARDIVVAAVGGGRDGIAARLIKAAASDLARADLVLTLWITEVASGSIEAGRRQSILAAGGMAARRGGQAAYRCRDEVFVVGGDVALEVAVGTLPVDDGSLSRMSGHSEEGDGKNSHGLEWNLMKYLYLRRIGPAKKCAERRERGVFRRINNAVVSA